MKVVKQIDIYLTSKRNVKVIDVVQYDTGIQLVFNVKDFSIPSGTTAIMYVQKPSGKFVYQEDEITVGTDTITIDLENQAITEHGKTPYQVTLTNGSDEITSFTGVMMVQKSLKDSGATESTTVIRAFDEAVSERIASFRTQAETIAAAVIATIPEDYTVMGAKVNELANAIKGHLTGEIVVASDVSPVEHIPEVWVHSKNLIPFPYAAMEATQAGVTFAGQEDGGILVSGTPTAYTSMAIYSGKPLCNKGKIAFSLDGDFTNVNGAIVMYDSDGNEVYSKETWKGAEPIVINMDEYPTVNKWLVFVKRGTNDIEMTGTVYPQIEVGENATEYEAWINPTTVTVRRCGKNLLPLPSNKTQNGITMTVSADGTYQFNGTATDHFTTTVALFLPANVGYIVSLRNSASIGTDTSTSPYLAIRDVTGEWLMNRTCTSANIVQTFKPQKSVASMLFVIPSGVTVNKFRISPQLEMGNVATEFEAYKGMTDCIPTSDGTVEGMTSLSPNMTILTDTAGVIVECEYNKDTNKVIQKICDALGIEV